MTTIAADQAKGEFDALLSRAAKGEEFTITDGGKPVARLVPARRTMKLNLPMTLEELRVFRENITLPPHVTIQQLIHEGHRY